MKTLKRTSVVLFGMVAIVAILAATELFAQDCVPPECLDANGKFKVWVLRTDNLFPTYDDPGNFIYDYRVDCISKTVNYIDIIIPNDIDPGTCSTGTWPCLNIGTYVGTSTDGGSTITWTETQYWFYLDGAGENGFGKDIDTHHVLKWKIAKTPTFYFRVVIKPGDKKQKVSASKAAMLLRTSIGQFSGVILGPSIPLPSQPGFIPLTVEDYKDFGPYPIRILRDPATWCATKVEEWDTETDAWVERPPEDYSSALIHCGTPDGNQRCAECLSFGAASPGCYTYTSGGVTYKVPKGCK